jgi:hypothetical protein
MQQPRLDECRGGNMDDIIVVGGGARAKNAQNCFLYRLLLGVVASTFGFQIYGIETEFVHAD